MEEKKDISSIELLMGRYLSGNCTPGESEAFIQWLEASEENRNQYAIQKALWLSSGSDNSKNPEEGWEALQHRIKERQSVQNEMDEKLQDTRERFLRVFRYAAAVILMAGLSVTLVFLFRSGDKSRFSRNILEVPLGSQSSLTLPDGTKLWVNSGSKLTYNPDFGKNNRDIYLTGEAFFDVTKNKKLPFIVHAGNLKIKALGTSFNIKAYPEDKKIETTLVEGLIEIEKQGVKESVMLKPNQKIIFTDLTIPEIEEKNDKTELVKTEDNTEIIIADEIDVSKETSWKDGKLVFDKEPLLQLTVKLARRYDVHFTFASENLKAYIYTGTFNDLSLEQIMEAMRISSPIDYVIREKEVILKERKEGYE